MSMFIFTSLLAYGGSNLSRIESVNFKSESGTKGISFDRAFKIYIDGTAPEKKKVVGKWASTLFACRPGVPPQLEAADCNEHPGGYYNPDGSMQSIEIIARHSDWDPEIQLDVFWNNLGTFDADQGPYYVALGVKYARTFMNLPRYGYRGSRINKSMSVPAKCRHPNQREDLLICTITLVGEKSTDRDVAEWFGRVIAIVGFKKIGLDE